MHAFVYDAYLSLRNFTLFGKWQMGGRLASFPFIVGLEFMSCFVMSGSLIEKVKVGLMEL